MQLCDWQVSVTAIPDLVRLTSGKGLFTTRGLVAFLPSGKTLLLVLHVLHIMNFKIGLESSDKLTICQASAEIQIGLTACDVLEDNTEAGERLL